ncbi:MAG: Y-family DNA polymerase [Succinivibrionaceae bacterium]
MSRIIGLADCNNFFVSCEKVFRPDLSCQPVIVLSNNDGCVISRSAEVKALGIPMGIPLFKITREIEKHRIAIFSSNFPLYGDMSNRVMHTIKMFCPDMEQYSIDEAFFDLTSQPDFTANLKTNGQLLRNYILRTTGIPVSIAFAPTKTLAKIGNYYVKKHPLMNGVIDLTNPDDQKKMLHICPVEEIWGIGKNLSEKLLQLNVRTAADLAYGDFGYFSKKFGVNMERIIYELNGSPCYDFAEFPAPRKQIMDSSTLGKSTDNPVIICESICNHIAQAAENLRRSNQVSSCLTIFFRGNLYKSGEKFQCVNESVAFDTPTSDTRQLLKAGTAIFARFYQKGSIISKTGIILSGLTPADAVQTNLFEQDSIDPRRRALMEVMDRINNEKKGKAFLLAQGVKNLWKSSRQHVSPCYTTRWQDIMHVK